MPHVITGVVVPVIIELHTETAIGTLVQSGHEALNHHPRPQLKVVYARKDPGIQEIDAVSHWLRVLLGSEIG